MLNLHPFTAVTLLLGFWAVTISLPTFWEALAKVNGCMDKIIPTAITRPSCQQLPFWLFIHWSFFYFLSKVASHPIGEPTRLSSSGSKCPLHQCCWKCDRKPESVQIFVPNLLKQNIWQWSPGICVLTSSSVDSCVCWTLRSTALLISALLTYGIDIGSSYFLRYSLHLENLKQLA